MKRILEKQEDKVGDAEMQKLVRLFAAAQQPLVEAILKRDDKTA